MSIYLVCQNGNLNILKKLIAAGIDINKYDTDGRTPLHWACRYGHLKMTEYLINCGANINVKTYYQCGLATIRDTALIIAISTNNTKLVNLLMNAGANVNIPDQIGQTPLHRAYDNYQIIKLLINAGADVNIPDRHGLIPLHESCKVSNYICVKELITAGSNVNALDSKGQTPLHIALKHGSNSIIKCLIDAGSQICHRNRRQLANKFPKQIVNNIHLTRNYQLIQYLPHKYQKAFHQSLITASQMGMYNENV
jgi:ankyrin repeat protein